MIKITTKNDISKIPNKYIREYIYNRLCYLLTEYNGYCPYDSIEPIGAIFFLESKHDLNKHKMFGFSIPITESRFEWIGNLEHGYKCACIVIDNDRAIDLIGKSEVFSEFMEDNNE